MYRNGLVRGGRGREGKHVTHTFRGCATFLVMNCEQNPDSQSQFLSDERNFSSFFDGNQNFMCQSLRFKISQKSPLFALACLIHVYFSPYFYQHTSRFFGYHLVA